MIPKKNWFIVSNTEVPWISKPKFSKIIKQSDKTSSKTTLPFTKMSFYKLWAYMLKISDFLCRILNKQKILSRILTQNVCLETHPELHTEQNNTILFAKSIIPISFSAIDFSPSIGYGPTRVLDVLLALSLLKWEVQWYTHTYSIGKTLPSSKTNVLGSVQKHKETITKFLS